MNQKDNQSQIEFREISYEWNLNLRQYQAQGLLIYLNRKLLVIKLIMMDRLKIKVLISALIPI